MSKSNCAHDIKRLRFELFGHCDNLIEDFRKLKLAVSIEDYKYSSSIIEKLNDLIDQVSLEKVRLIRPDNSGQLDAIQIVRQCNEFYCELRFKKEDLIAALGESGYFGIFSDIWESLDIHIEQLKSFLGSIINLIKRGNLSWAL